MKNKILYQVRIDLDDDLAHKIRSDHKYQEVEVIKKSLKKFDAELVCQFDAFKNFLNECKKAKDTENPLYKWTKDTVENEAKKKKYLRSFTIYVKKNQLYEKSTAEKIETKIKSLKNKKIFSIRIFNSDPKSNPQPPKKYF